MQDPKPANISGSKTVTHSYSHRFDWGYVAAGVGMVALAYVLYKIFCSGSKDDEDGVFQ